MAFLQARSASLIPRDVLAALAVVGSTVTSATSSSKRRSDISSRALRTSAVVSGPSGPGLLRVLRIAAHTVRATPSAWRRSSPGWNQLADTFEGSGRLSHIRLGLSKIMPSCERSGVLIGYEWFVPNK